ncbi:MAG: dipeptidase PepE [Planctomycetota bacterium]|nr:MAG: dipeptidase PepE [Planctomycetota bacterium]
MKLLLGSGGFRTEERKQVLGREMRAHFGDVSRILFVPFALADHEAYVAGLYERGLDFGYELDGIHKHRDPVQAVNEAEAIYVGGGNSFRLAYDLQRLGLICPIRERVRSGLPYLGVSAGTNAACPTIMTTNDMPIVMPSSFEALGLVPFQINPHYYSGSLFLPGADGYDEHFGETRDERIQQFHEVNETPVIGLWEGDMLRVEDARVTLLGERARIFRRGEAARDLPAGEIDPALLGY